MTPIADLSLAHEAATDAGAASWKPSSPSKMVACLFHKSGSGALAFVTREPDGLYYVWARTNRRRRADWTYAYKRKNAALVVMRKLAGYSKRKPVHEMSFDHV